jgi:uncharacterized protein (TIGR02452 family)
MKFLESVIAKERARHAENETWSSLQGVDTVCGHNTSDTTMPPRSGAQRAERARLAQETLDIIKAGSHAIESSKRRSEFVSASHSLSPPAKPTPGEPLIEVADEGTLSAAWRFYERGLHAVALNFASWKNPGGGWLGGAQAQEEALARSSALYAALTAPGPCADHYQKKKGKDPLYGDDMIYSPDVPVLRTEGGDLLSSPWPLAFISAAAPNAGVARERGVSDAEIEVAYAARAERVLSLAVCRGHDSVILGAWGCGVFKNHPAVCARIWAALLRGKFCGAFKAVAFPVMGPSANREAFKAVLLREGVAPERPPGEPAIADTPKEPCESCASE